VIVEVDTLAPGVTRLWSGAHDGFTAEWTRIIEKDGEKKTETLVSVYEPWPARILKGIDPNAIEEESEVDETKTISMN